MTNRYENTKELKKIMDKDGNLKPVDKDQLILDTEEARSKLAHLLIDCLAKKERMDERKKGGSSK